MENIFYSLGLTTQKNHTEILQVLQGIQAAIADLSEQIKKLNFTQARHADILKNLDAKISSSHDDILKNLYAKISSSHDDILKNLEEVEQLLKLSVVNQIMDLSK